MADASQNATKALSDEIVEATQKLRQSKLNEQKYAAVQKFLGVDKQICNAAIEAGLTGGWLVKDDPGGVPTYSVLSPENGPAKSMATKTAVADDQGASQAPDASRAAQDVSTKMLEISSLVVDEQLQPRDKRDEDTIDNYRQALARGAKFPPILVFLWDNKLHLVDGFHRVEAFKQAGMERIEAKVEEGTLQEAALRAVQENLRHGLPLKVAERKRRLEQILRDDANYRKYTNDTQMGKDFGLDPKTCGALFKLLFPEEEREPQYQDQKGVTKRTGKRKQKESKKNGTAERSVSNMTPQSTGIESSPDVVATSPNEVSTDVQSAIPTTDTLPQGSEVAPETFNLHTKLAGKLSDIAQSLAAISDEELRQATELPELKHASNEVIGQLKRCLDRLTKAAAPSEGGLNAAA